MFFGNQSSAIKNSPKVLEDSYSPIDLTSVERFDVIVVLGGGTHSSPYKRPQLSAAGDRVSLACRMYHLKLVDKILVTGDPLRGAPNEKHLDRPCRPSKFFGIRSRRSRHRGDRWYYNFRRNALAKETERLVAWQAVWTCNERVSYVSSNEIG